MITPIILPITLYALDDFDLQLNWRERCGPTYDLQTYDARMTFWPTKIDRSGQIYQITKPMVSGNGITLNDTSPNIWAHILAVNVDFDPAPGWYILELQTPAGADAGVDGVWFRLAEGKVTYEV